MKKNISNKLAAGMAVSMGAMSMVGGVAPIFAAPVAGVSGEQTDIDALLATITATGITEEGVAVKAYQLVDGYYDNGNLIRYVLTDPANGAIANIEAPTAEEITAIANKIGAGAFEGQAIDMVKGQDGNFTAQAEPGLYLILVSGSTDTVFNPAIVAVNVNDANAVAAGKITSETVDLTSAFEVEGTAAYIKSSKSSMDKNIVDDAGAEIGYGDAVATGDVIHFVLDDMTIPSFSADFEAPVYKITDVLEGGKFENITNIKVFINDVETAADSSTFTLTNNGTDFVINFAESFLRAHAADATRPTVKVTYDTALLDAADMNFAENYNHAKIEYSNDPADQTSMKEVVKNNYVYSFSINGLADAEAGDDVNDDMNKIEYAKKGADTEAKRYELAGATFAISKNEDMSAPMAEAVSGDDGRFVFDGLDVGTYYVKEIQAPAGYVLNDNTYKVVISAEFDEATGIMESYSVVTQMKASNGTAWEDAGSAVYTNTIADDAVAADGSVTNNVASNVTTVDIVNTKIQSLPSTGGAGTAMAFAVSAGLAATAGGITVSAKKKARK